MIEFYRRAKKAVHGAILAAIPPLILVTASDSIDGENITRNEWLAVIGAVLGVGGVVYQARNHAALRRGDDGSIEPGSMALGIIVGLLAGWLLWA